MLLCIDRSHPTLPFTFAGTGRPITFDRPYTLHDAPGHTVILHKLSDDSVGIDIKRAGFSKPVRREVVELLNPIVDYTSDGTPLAVGCTLDLHPDKPIFPLTGLVRMLMRAMKIDRTQLTSVTQFTFSMSANVHAAPNMFSDGDVIRRREQGVRDLKQSFRFTIRRGTGTWAILANGRDVNHVYLTLNAAARAKEIVNAINLIRSGMAQPIYDGE